MEPRRTRGALLLVHGIGEQRPYETLDRFARGLLDAAARVTGAGGPRAPHCGDPPRVRNIELGGTIRAVVGLPGMGGMDELDLVELHWAGRPKGRIGALGVVAWILRVGLAPLNFGYRLPASTRERSAASAVAREALQIAGLLAVVGALVAGTVWLASLAPSMVRLGMAAAAALTPARALALAAVAVPFATGLALGSGAVRNHLAGAGIARRSAGAWRGISERRRARLTLPLVVTVGSTLGIAVAAAALLRDPLAALAGAFAAAVADHDGAELALAGAAALAVLALGRWLADWVGDIALYVTADRGDDRQPIRRTVENEGCATLRELLDGRYDAVFLAGHSLGSVIAYDLLNQLVREARAGAVPPRDLARFAGLLTFGSPLDKIHAVFRERVAEEQAVRAQLLSFLHPVRKRPSERDDGPYRLRSYAVPLERFRWLNVWTPLDPISDRLRNYFVDEQRVLPVRWPLGAHGAYWREPQFFRWVCEWLADAELPDAARTASARRGRQAPGSGAAILPPMEQRPRITVVGAGMAGSDAALAAARAGVDVDLYEMRPTKSTPAHHTDRFAEMVCSNSFGGESETNAKGLLQAEMLAAGGIVMTSAHAARVPAGGALAVDRERFGDLVTSAVAEHPRIRVHREELRAIPDGVVVLASGPLTSDALAEAIRERVGMDFLGFYDAAAPVVDVDSIDMDVAYRKGRYAQTADYLNLPFTKEQYDVFFEALANARKHVPHDWENLEYFEACIPIEELARRGYDTPRFGPMKPVGLEHPDTGERFFAVAQLRQEDVRGQMWSLVGFQTGLKWGDQKTVLQTIPGLADVEIVRYGVMHRNTYLNAPRLLEPTLGMRDHPELFVAGVLAGTEGYLESSATGWLAGTNAARRVLGLPPVVPPEESMLGGLVRFLATGNPDDFQPMNANWGLVPAVPKKTPDGTRLGKRERRAEMYRIGRRAFAHWLEHTELAATPALA